MESYEFMVPTTSIRQLYGFAQSSCPRGANDFKVLGFLDMSGLGLFEDDRECSLLRPHSDEADGGERIHSEEHRFRLASVDSGASFALAQTRE